MTNFGNIYFEFNRLNFLTTIFVKYFYFTYTYIINIVNLEILLPTVPTMSQKTFVLLIQIWKQQIYLNIHNNGRTIAVI